MKGGGTCGWGPVQHPMGGGLTQGPPGLAFALALAQALGVGAEAVLGRQLVGAHEAVPAEGRRSVPPPPGADGVRVGGSVPSPLPLGYLLYSLLSEPLSLPLSVPSDGHWFTKGVTISLESCASWGFSHGISPVLWHTWGGNGEQGGPTTHRVPWVNGGTACPIGHMEH